MHARTYEPGCRKKIESVTILMDVQDACFLFGQLIALPHSMLESNVIV
jgi:hypothetical protein